MANPKYYRGNKRFNLDACSMRGYARWVEQWTLNKNLRNLRFGFGKPIATKKIKWTEISSILFSA